MRRPVLRLAHAWTTVRGQTGYDPDCDFNGDGIINVIDLLTLSRNFARTTP